jgi:adenine deaminase
MSNKSATEVAQELRHLTQVVARALGVTLEAPFMQLSFLGLSVIPELRITDRGLVDVMTFSLTDVGAV